MSTPGNELPFVLNIDTAGATKSGDLRKRTLYLNTSFDNRYTLYHMKVLGGCIRTNDSATYDTLGVRLSGFKQYGAQNASPQPYVAFACEQKGFLLEPGFECVVSSPTFSEVVIEIENMVNPLGVVDEDLILLLQFTPIDKTESRQ